MSAEQTLSADVALPDELPGPAAPADAGAPLTWAVRFWSVLGLLPEMVGAALAVYCVVAMALLVTGHYRPALALPIGGLAALAAAVFVARLCWPVLDRRWSRRCADVVVLLGGLAFAAVNARYAAQDLLAFRDPTTYNIDGEWLVRHGSALVNTSSDVFGPAARHLAFATPGFRLTGGGHLYPQGNHLLPALLAVGGWVGGTAWLERTNALLGGVALLVLYGLIRKFAHPVASALCVCGLALSLPMIEFARDTYTEVVELALLAAAALLFWRALERRSSVALFLAGLAFGGVPLAHVDGLYSQLAFIAFVAVFLAVAPPGTRAVRVRQAVALAVGDAIALSLSLLDLYWDSPLYFHDLHKHTKFVEAGAVGLAVLGALVVAAYWLVPRLAAPTGRLSRRLAAPAAGLVVVGAAVLGSRPWWMHAQGLDSNSYVVFLQKAERLPIDSTASYAQLTLDWVGWYLGWVTVGLGVLGTAYLVWRALRRPDPRWLAFFFIYLSVALLYLNKPTIVPDQLWATRRLLWAVYPGLLIGAAVALSWLLARSRRTVPVVAVLGLLVAGLPLIATRHVFKVRVGTPMLAQTRAVCHAVGPRGAVVVIGDVAHPDLYLAAVRGYCNVPVAQLGRADRTTLATLEQAAAAHGRQLFAMANDEAELDAVATTIPLVFSQVYVSHWNARLTGPVDASGADPHPVFLVRVRPDGTVAALSERGPVQLSGPA